MEGMFGEAGERKVYDTCSRKTPLHIAALQGNESIVDEILWRNPELAEELDSQQRSALHMASAKGQVEIARKLLSAAPEMCLSRDCQGRNPLHLAAIKGHVRVVELLLRRAPVAATERLDRGQTVLHLCVKHGRVDALKLLVPKLSDLACVKDDDGETILHLAVRYKQVEVVQFLVENRYVNTNATNSRGQTPLRISKRSCSAPPGDTDSGTITKILQQASSIYDGATDRQVEWLTRKRDTIMVVAILIATVAFQAGVNPAGGVWQGSLDVNGNNNITAGGNNNITAATPADGQRQPNPGEAVMATRHPKIYRNFIRFNTAAFVLSLSTILLLVSGLPFKRRPFMWGQMAIMWASVTCIAVAYAASIMAVTPNYKVSLRNVIQFGIYAWSALMVILLVGNSLRLLDRWLQRKGIILRPPQRVWNLRS